MSNIKVEVYLDDLVEIKQAILEMDPNAPLPEGVTFDMRLIVQRALILGRLNYLISKGEEVVS